MEFYYRLPRFLWDRDGAVKNSPRTHLKGSNLNETVFSEEIPMAEYKFKIEGKFYGNKTFPSLNSYLSECGKNPRAGGKMKRDYLMISVNAIRQQLPKVQAMPPVHIHYDFYEPDKKRDKGNVFAFADKVIEDALQAAGVIGNDNWYWVQGFSHDFYIDKEHPRIEVTITEVGR